MKLIGMVDFNLNDIRNKYGKIYKIDTLKQWERTYYEKKIPCYT